MSLSPASRLGTYEIAALIGAGGMGEVYRARDTTLDRLVAIKVLPKSLAGDPDRIARFEREAKTLAALKAELLKSGLSLTIKKRAINMLVIRQISPGQF